MSVAPPVTSTSVTVFTDNISATTVQCTATSPSLIRSDFKQESRDDSAKTEKLSPRQQTPNTPITFSITNILSNNFGHTKLSTNTSPISPNNNEVLSEKKNSGLFRPYDDDFSENAEISPKQVRMDRRQQSDDEDSNGELFFFHCRLFSWYNPIEICI